MTQKVLLFTAIACITYLTLTSNKGGAGAASLGNCMGVPGVSTGTCNTGGCHTSSIGTTTVAFEVRKKFKPDSNAIVNSYLPDSLYTVHMYCNHSTLNKFGYQLMVIKFSDTSTAGAISGFNTTKSSKLTIAGREILESKDTISKTGSNADITFTWKAPAKSSGSVRFHSMVIAANGDGSPLNDQASNTITYTLAEGSVSVPKQKNDFSFEVFPNPVYEQLNIRSLQVANGNYALFITNAVGQTLTSKLTIVSDNSLKINLNTTNWSQGMYFITLTKDGVSKIMPVVKQ